MGIMKENILILSNNLNGLYSFRKEVIQAVKDAGYNIYISIPDADNRRIPFFEGMGCHVFPIGFDRRGVNPLADIKLLFNYIKLLKRVKPKVVLTYTIKPNVYGGIATRLCGVPQLANVTGLGDAVENGGWMQKLTVTLYKIGLGKAQCVFFQNKTNQDFCIRQGISGNKTKLLPGSGVNLNYHIFQEYPEDGIVKILYVGRLLKDKGSDELLEMAKAVKALHQDVEFQIIGPIEGDYTQHLDELEAKKVIYYLGNQLDVRPFIGQAHCTIMPSYHEGMSNVNLESSANGRPVITTNVPGCKETVDDGQTGYLVEAKSTESLIQGVERFLALPYNQKKLMGQKARKKVEREFDRQIIIDAYLKEIESISNV